MSAPEDCALLVVEVLPALSAALGARGVAVLTAPPGSGKTTLAPLHLLGAPWMGRGRIVMLEPRRVAARAAAARMAQLIGEAVGGRVGYQIRFERRTSARTRIEVLTEGLLTRRLQADPDLAGVDLLIFDEFHERSLHADLALALALEAREMLRPDLRILIMSATLDAARVAALLDDAPVIESHGRSFPVAVRYRPVEAASHGLVVARGVSSALAETGGDVLAFLPGGLEIGEAQRALESEHPSLRVLPLHGSLTSAQQDAALRAATDGVRKVILATNIAQTSLTVEGVGAVVDGGLVRVARYDLGAGADVLVTRRVSRASADQRAGRAGRLGPGVALRLWSQDQQTRLEAFDTPELLSADLSRFVLELAAWGHRDPQQLRLLDRPPEAGWQAAAALLMQLGALDRTGSISTHGRALLRLPLSPRLGHMLLMARNHGLAATAAWIAAFLETRDISGSIDLAEQLESVVRGRCAPSVQARLQAVAGQMLRAAGVATDVRGAQPEATGRVVAFAYPERLALRRPSGGGVFLCADGGEARVAVADPLAAADWLAIAHWTPGAGRRIRAAVAIDEALVRRDHSAMLREEDRVDWDESEQAVRAERLERFGAIILRRRPWPHADRTALREALLRGIRQHGAGVLPWSPTVRQWQARVLSLRAWRPGENWPDVSDTRLMACLETWLAPWLDGITRFAQLTALDLQPLLAALLDVDRLLRMERLAPTHLTVSSGSRLRLEYAVDGSPPVLAVKLQELFGQIETPTVDDGRRPVLLHLLSPARRPIQVTRDLRSFWTRTYDQVRKELKGRYPRHPWPQDPLRAAPDARAKPRGR